jgi:glycosyltransferase involved in cell wall biosynthesis
MEWIIIDDGTDKVEDVFAPFIDVYNIKYFKYDDKMTLGKKRNLAHEKCIGDIIAYMDDDDYYPPERISHAVETLQKNPDALCVGSSVMYIYFKHITKMYQFGPYGPNHSTAATFAFRKELLQQTSFDDDACLAEEKKFLKNYTVPFAQLDPLKSILVFSHNHNSFDKKTLLKGMPNNYVKESSVSVDDFIKEKDIKEFFMTNIDSLLDDYEYGKPEHKPDVLKQMDKISKKREEIIKQNNDKLQKYNSYNSNNNDKINEMTLMLEELLLENKTLKNKVAYLEEKITKIIKQQIEEKRKLQNF